MMPCSALRLLDYYSVTIALLFRILRDDEQRNDYDYMLLHYYSVTIALLFQILRDDEQRNDYDYMLDHPGLYKLSRIEAA